MGLYAQALGDNSVARGTGSEADRADAVSVGAGPNVDGFAEERQITHVAAGTEDTDAVNLAQLEEVAKTADNTDYFFKASADPDNDSVGAYVEGANATAAGEAANAIGYGASAFGSGPMALAEYTTATGLASLDSAADATPYRAGSQATGDGPRSE